MTSVQQKTVSDRILAAGNAASELKVTGTLVAIAVGVHTVPVGAAVGGIATGAKGVVNAYTFADKGQPLMNAQRTIKVAGILGVAGAAVVILGATLATFAFSPREPGEAVPDPRGQSTAAVTTAASSSATPSVEVGEPASAEPVEAPPDGGAPAAIAPRPTGSLPRPATAKPPPSGDPFNRWR